MADVTLVNSDEIVVYEIMLLSFFFLISTCVTFR